MKESEIPDIQNEDANAELAELKKKDLQKEKKNSRNIFIRNRFPFQKEMYHILFRFNSNISKMLQMWRM